MYEELELQLKKNILEITLQNVTILYDTIKYYVFEM